MNAVKQLTANRRVTSPGYSSNATNFMTNWSVDSHAFFSNLIYNQE